MSDKNIQNDFFDDYFEEKKGRKPRFLGKYSEQRFLSHVRIPIEHMVIITIGVLMLIIIAYAAGVERGKRNSHIIEDVKVPEGSLPVVAEEIKEAEVMFYTETGEEKQQDQKDSPDAEKPVITNDDVQLSSVAEQDEEEIVPDPYESAYIIQVASFRQESSAKEEVAKLKNKGIEAGLTKKGYWYQVYASGYRTIEEAQKAMQELLGSYIDCYIRKVK